MYLPYVIDMETNTKYIIGNDTPPLGEGATAKVWEGVDVQNPASPPVAVKIAHRGTPADLLEEFWGEVSILNNLAKTEAKGNVPWAHRGTMPDAPAAAIIIMELIPDAWQLTRHAQDAGGKLPERTAVLAGLQYAQLLVALHAMGLTTRGDRKAADLRWDASHLQPRLVVLDWNRAKAIPDNMPVPVREELIRQDLHGFGQLWAELTLGHKITALPSIDDEADSDWAALTRGFRIILAKALGSRIAWGYQKAEELVNDLQTHIERLGLLSNDYPSILREAKYLRTKVGMTQDPGEQATLADAVLTLVDLLTRAPSVAPADCVQIAELKDWAVGQACSLAQQAGDAVAIIQRELGLEMYGRAADIARDIMGQFKGQGIELHGAFLRVARWLVVAEAGMRGNELGMDMRSITQSLTKCVGFLEEAANARTNSASAETIIPLGNALAPLEKAERDGPSEIGPILRPLALEIRIRQNIASALQAESQRRLQVATDRYNQALMIWQDLEQSDALYAENLRAVLEPLDSRLSRQTQETALFAKSREKTDRYAKALDSLMAAIRA